MNDERADLAAALLDELCMTFPDRHVGGPGNLAATRLFAERAANAGLAVEAHAFDCLDWEAGEASLETAGGTLPLHVGPYSPPCETRARLVALDSVEALAAADIREAVVLAHGELAREQLTPKAYPFYRVEAHTRIISLLEAGEPFALVAATGSCPMTAALRPFPMVEDGDFGIPHAYLDESAAPALLAHAGEDVTVRIGSRRLPATAEQVVARHAGSVPGRVLVSAHIDSRHGTPGALDNATGVVVLLLVAEMLAETGGLPTVELLPFNGEDDYAAPGQMEYLRLNGDRFDDVALLVNLDAAAHAGHESAVSFYGCADAFVRAARAALQGRHGFVEGPAWVQGDHSIFTARGVPAMAITSDSLDEIAATVAHTPRDTPDLADPAAIVRIARFIVDVIPAAARR